MKRIVLGISLGGLAFLGCGDGSSPSTGGTSTSGGDTGGMGGVSSTSSASSTGGAGGVASTTSAGSTASSSSAGSTSGAGGAGGMASASSAGGAGGMASTSSAGGAGGMASASSASASASSASASASSASASASSASAAASTGAGGAPGCVLDGVLTPPEECDDGNTVNLDGCDASCKFEQDLRSNYLQMQFGVDAFCGGVNKLGAAIPNTIAQGQVQNSITNGVTAGSTGVVFKMLGLDSLTGGDDPKLELGVVRALPFAGAGYTGSSDLEWWYNVSAGTIDAARNPIDKLPGSLLGGTLTAGPGAMSLAINFFPSSATVLRLSSVKLQIAVGANATPGSAAGAMPPGHLPSEHLDPALQSFSHLGQSNASFSGKLCGDISAKSLSQAPIPSELLPGGSFPCSEGYTAASSFLDVIVSGCNVNLGIPVLAIAPSQPDKVDPAAAVGGAGAPYKLNVNAQKIVTSCSDKSNAPVSLSVCLDAAAYSSFFRLAMDRVILK